MEKEQTALQLIAEAARCPVYEPERILALMEKLGINEKGFALLMNVAPLYCTVMDQWSFTAIWYCNAPYADL